MYVQSPKAVVMIRPYHFRSNPETAADNAFQRLGNEDASAAARSEFDHVVDTLRNHGVTVHDFDDTSSDTPDSVFPNNWFSTHAGGHVAVYPMYAANRRRERRWDAIELQGNHGLIMALSARALEALSPDQIDRIEATAQTVPLTIPTIETAGGSVRCMIAGLHLARRT